MPAGSGPVTPLTGWRVDVARLRRDHRGRQTFTGHQAIDELSLPAAEVPDGTVDHALDVDATSSDAVVTGTVSFSWRAGCRRCLEPVEGAATVEVQEIYQPVAVAGETWPIVDDVIDLEPMVRETVLLALPASVVCRDDCAGPSEGDYRVGLESEAVTADDHTDDRPGDPRWAALDELRFD